MMEKTREQKEAVSCCSGGSSEAKYKGVRKRKWGKWVSEIRLPNSRERIWLGSYDKPQKAARAFDAALFCLRGPDAKFNFPETSPPSGDIIVNQGGRATSLTPQEIQVIAARFANEEPSAPSANNDRNNTSPPSDGTAGVHVESGGSIDWSFLNTLDSNEGASHFGFYSGLDSMNLNHHDEFYAQAAASAASPAPAADDTDEDVYTYGTSSFLWNF